VSKVEAFRKQARLQICCLTCVSRS